MKNLALCLSFAALAAAAVSCDPASDNSGDGPEGVQRGGTAVLGREAGDTLSVSYVFDADWRLSDVPDWLDVRPRSGTAGEYVLSFAALSDNAAAREREWDGGGGVYAVQRPSQGIEPAESSVSVAAVGGSVKVDVWHNVDFTVESGEDWIDVSAEVVDEAPVLGDGVTVSEDCLSSLVCVVEPNQGGARSGKVVLKAGGQEYVVEVEQEGESLPEWDREFYRNSLFLRFTATWCSYCPWMEEALKEAQELCPDRVVTVCCHPDDSQGGMAWTGTAALEERYSVSSYPTGIMNDMARFKNQAVELTSAEVAALATEAVESYPARCGAAVSSVVSQEGNLDVNVRLAAREAGEYRLHVYVVEDGIVFKQAGTGKDDYVHDGVVRAALTALDGDAVTFASERSVEDRSFSVPVPEGVADVDSSYVVVYVTRPGSADVKGVEGADYEDFGTLVDNVFVCPLRGSAGFRYE